MKYFIVSDVHSFYNELMLALENEGWTNSEDQCFVCLGDLIDRGDQTIECLKFVNDLPNSRKILVRGNHEDLMEMLLHRGYFRMHDIHNGTFKSCTHIALYEDSTIDPQDDYKVLKTTASSELLQTYLKSTVDFAEVGNNVFVHGWIPCTSENVLRGDTFMEVYNKLPAWRKGDWSDARWVNGMAAWDGGARIRGKTIWCGHWHSSWGNHYLHHDGLEFDSDGEKANSEPFVDKGIVAMDACTARSRKVNCKVIEV